MKDLLLGARRGLAGGILLVLVLLALTAWYSFWVPGHSSSGVLPVKTDEISRLATALRGDVAEIARAPHNRDHPVNLGKVADFIAGRLSSLGHAVNQQQFDTHDDLPSRNIWVEISPRAGAFEWLVIGAHYDSAGKAPGANDNGSGVAVILKLARRLQSWKPERLGVVLVLFANEEPPYFGTDDMGSRHFARHLAEAKQKVAGMISIETVGWFDDRPGSQDYPPLLSPFYPSKGNFLAFVAMPGSRGFMHRTIAAFREVSPIPTIGGVAPGIIPGIDWSDHASFADQSIPALMITDTALFRYPHYHKPTDTPDKLDYERLAHVTLGIEHIVNALTK